jgi:hypothetical protein
MISGWLAWRMKAIVALAKTVADDRAPEGLREEARKMMDRLAELDSRYRLPTAKMLSLTAKATAVIAKAVASGLTDIAAAAIPEPAEVDDLARGREPEPSVSFNAWKAKVVAALARAVASAADPELKATLVEAAELVAEAKKPRRAKSWRARGARFLADLADLVATAAEETGSEELKALVPDLAAVKKWLGGGPPALPPWLAERVEKPPLTEQALLEWLRQRLSTERGNETRVQVQELLASFDMARGQAKWVEETLERAKAVDGWEYVGTESVWRGGRRKRVALIFRRAR